MSCFNFLNNRSFTGMLKPLGILVPIRKPEHGKKSYNHYILGLKLKKLDVLTSKKNNLSLQDVWIITPRYAVCIVQHN